MPKATGPHRLPPLIAIDFERSGVDAGTIVYTIQNGRVRDLSDADFEDLLECVNSLKRSASLSGDHHQPRREP